MFVDKKVTSVNGTGSIGMHKINSRMANAIGNKIKNLTGDDVPIHIMLAGVLDPDLKNQELLNKFNAVTPVEAVKKIFLPGEIEDISREIEKLSGYRMTTIEDIKKK